MSSHSVTALREQLRQSKKVVTLGISLILLLVSLLAIGGYFILHKNNASMERIVAKHYAHVELVNVMRSAARQRLTIVLDVMLQSDPFVRDELLEQFWHQGQVFWRAYSTFVDMEMEAEQQVLNSRLRDAINLNDDIRERVINLAFMDDINIRPEQLIEDFRTAQAPLFQILDELYLHHHQQITIAQQSAQEYYQFSPVLLFVFFAIIIILSLYIMKRIQRDLQTKGDQLIESNIKMSIFIATMSHEIRSPLTSIIGFGETLLDTNSNKEERIASINSIVRNGQHLLDVVNEVLDYSKLQAEQMTLNVATHGVKELLADLDILIARRAKDKQIEFEIEATTHLPTFVNVDIVKLRQILINILSNACKFTQQGSVKLMVRYIDDQHKLEFSISDTGPGIPADKQKELFLAYEHGGEQEGTGLGLYISKKLVDLMQGDIEVDSVVGQGSRFTITIPCGENIESNFFDWEPEAVRLQTLGNLGTSVRLSGNVLLAEDRIDNQQLFSIYINKAGANLTIVNNGEDAVEEALEHHFEVILMDLQMPVMNGIDAVKTLRKKACHTPVIALTANTQDEDREQCLRAGFNDFLTKPVTRSAFLEVMARYLNQEDGTSAKPIRNHVYDEQPELRVAIDYFVNSLSTISNQLEQQLEQNNWPQLRETLHDLKGTAGGVGYPSLTQAAMEAGFALAKGDMEEAEERVKGIVALIEMVQQGYREQVKKGANTTRLNETGSTES
ncbi:MAG: response regulator [Gammaproteobacteria bacterium]|nr:response regulator [Gammaproteobacteria bacterium]